MAVKRYDGSAWQVVAGKGDQGTSSSISTWVKTASGGETSLSGNDDNSQSLSYTVGQELVFINGTLLKRGSDYTATNGTSITGLTALAANDVATVWTVNAFSVTNAISSGLVTTTGDMIYASGANTPARLAIGSTDQVLKVSGGVPVWGAAPSPSFVGCSLVDSAAGGQSISNSTWTALTWDSEDFDTDGFHSTSSNTDRITIPSGKAGKYLVTGIAGWGSETAGRRNHGIYKNGTLYKAITMSPAAQYPQASISFIINLIVGDYLSFYVWQNTGTSITVYKNVDAGHFSVTYLGA